ncbi:uncharacterized protein CEXT_769851 [Caerostris extrusa]|uniref:Uncharacterized protein n=1 Tax=Caerostris extrusa TaxID=172846 RepID=A0AAV4YEF3_CAEEX|nr:uncharacterized protein CEXT_769851 [Caerostris extrusa]
MLPERSASLQWKMLCVQQTYFATDSFWVLLVTQCQDINSVLVGERIEKESMELNEPRKRTESHRKGRIRGIQEHLGDSVPRRTALGWRMNRGRVEHFERRRNPAPLVSDALTTGHLMSRFSVHFISASCPESPHEETDFSDQICSVTTENLFSSRLNLEQWTTFHIFKGLYFWSFVRSLSAVEEDKREDLPKGLKMMQVKLMTCLFVVYELHYALSEGDVFSRKARKLLGFQNSRGFRYNVKDELEQSSHFRKEERDRNGVSSRDLQHEPGVGRQSPASVSVDRLPPAAHTRTSNHPDLQVDRKIPGGQGWPSGYDFYAPRNNQDSNNPEESSKKTNPLDLQKHLNKQLRFVSKSPKTDSSIPESNESFDAKDPISWPLIPEDNSEFSSPGTTSTEIKEMSNFPHHLMSNTFPSFDNGDNVDRRPTRVPLGIINLLLNYPQQKSIKIYQTAIRISPFIQTSDDKEKFIEATLMGRLFKFVSTSDKNFPPESSLKDFTLQNEKRFLNPKGVLRKDSPCSDNTNENKAGDLDLTTF